MHEVRLLHQGLYLGSMHKYGSRLRVPGYKVLAKRGLASLAVWHQGLPSGPSLEMAQLRAVSPSPKICRQSTIHNPQSTWRVLVKLACEAALGMSLMPPSVCVSPNRLSSTNFVIPSPQYSTLHSGGDGCVDVWLLSDPHNQILSDVAEAIRDVPGAVVALPWTPRSRCRCRMGLNIKIVKKKEYGTTKAHAMAPVVLALRSYEGNPTAASKSRLTVDLLST
ncbi:hypothetical protein HYFRA_00007765 [Hymenoscyphus fraxineus]|uniref:Uncharacterized protein n=1 Tax=Hymenoscyphus fraxineus TaxID=746836 RepID=A0A9N9KM56_9HELO|nr:hypothetical protein HYFRA_00007765 [Hymenoscyphus fraxineus]